MIETLRSLSMTAEREALFRRKAQKKTGKYFWIANIFVLLFQIYNILYVLSYTGFQLKSQASKVYLALYILMLLSCVLTAALGLVWTKGKTEQSARLLRLYAAFGCILLLWSACITLYDQRVSNNLSVYLTAAVYVAGFIYIKPQAAVPVYVLCETILLSGTLGMGFKSISDIYGFCVNSVGLTLVSLFISLYRWASLRKDFLGHLEMEEKNRMITEQSEKLNYLANHDPLTGLWNRNYLNEWKKNFFAGKGSHQIAVFVIDIDYFKNYNDSFGHMEGDECLKKVACSLQEEEGTLFRFGGEEFLCLQPVETEEQAALLADKLCLRIQNQQIVSSKSGSYLTISVGYSVGSMEDDPDFAKLLHQADTALYRAKSEGRNQAVRFESGE